jgi:hypothetical protein
VLGATDLGTDLIRSLRGSPHAFLCPGIGAQGAHFNQQTSELSKAHPATLFPISRGMIKADVNDSLSSWEDYQAMVANRWQKWITAWQSSR